MLILFFRLRKILEELWCENVCPSPRKATQEEKALMGHIADNHDHLQATLTDKQKEILEKFHDCYTELTDINESEVVVYAFQLGGRIAIEVMNFSVE